MSNKDLVLQTVSWLDRTDGVRDTDWADGGPLSETCFLLFSRWMGHFTNMQILRCRMSRLRRGTEERDVRKEISNQKPN